MTKNTNPNQDLEPVFKRLNNSKFLIAEILSDAYHACLSEYFQVQELDNHIRTVEIYLQERHNPNVCDLNQIYPLHYAAGCGNLDLLNILVDFFLSC